MAMMRIPKPYEIGLVKIFNLSEGAIYSLTVALADVKPTLKSKALAASIAAKVQGITPQDIESLIDTLASLSLARMSMEMSISEFAENIVEAIEESEIKPQNLNEDTRSSFKSKLESLLNIGVIRIAAKADEVLHQHEHALSRVRIFTDIRPVFGDEPKAAPEAIVIVHSLKLTYIQEGDLKDFFVAMDASDIKMLRDALDRAEQKAESLKAILSQSNLSYIGSE